MKRLDAIKTAVDIVKTVIDGGIAVADARRRAREEEERKQRERDDTDRDRRIRELQAENDRLRSLGRSDR